MYLLSTYHVLGYAVGTENILIAMNEADQNIRVLV